MDSLFFIVIGYIVVQMFFVWMLAAYIKNPSIVDVAWPIGLMISGFIYLFSSPVSFRIAVITVLLLVWGLRLSGYLYFTRIQKGIVDKRYLDLSEHWKISKSLGYLLNFQLQGLLIFLISSVFYFAIQMQSDHLYLLDYLAVILCVLGVLGETIADLQLQHFKASHTGMVCNIGLWNYSRHPNYFFDWLAWCGFALFGLNAPYGYLVVISPIVLYLIMTKMTGPLTEKGSIESRGKLYLDYQKITPMFFPGRKKT